MATTSLALQGFDQMAGTLQQVNNQLNSTVINMNKVVNVSNQNINMIGSLNIISIAAKRANEGLQQLENTENNVANAQKKLSDSSNVGSGGADGLLSKIKGFAANHLGFENIKQGIKSTIGGAMELQQQLVTLQGIMGNKDVATAYFNTLQKKANESGFGLEDLSANARKFMQVTKNTNSLDKLSNLSERLTLIDPSLGLQGAGSALRAMMSGDGASLKEKFGFGSADIEILKATKSMDDFISKFDTLLNKKGFTESTLKQYNQTPTAQFDNLQSNLKTGLAQAGNGALEILTPVMTRLNDAFSNGSFQPFFDGLSNGIAGAVNLILWLADGIQGLGGLFNEVFPIIGPIILGVVGALIAYNTAVAIGNIITGISNVMKIMNAVYTGIQNGELLAATSVQIGLNTAMYACPLVWIIGLVIGFIVALVALIAFCEPIRSAFAIAFQGIANACANAFGFVVDTVQGVLNWIINNINPFLDKINNISGTVAKLWGGSGTNLHIDNVDFSDFKIKGQDAIRDFGAAGSQKIQNFSAENIKNSIKNAMGLGSIPKGGEQSKMSDLNTWNAKQGPGKLPMDVLSAQGSGKIPMNGLDDGSKEHLNNIDDKIDISNEHLEMLRDLAEMESIQNFVTLTPTVQVTTGDIREETDINKIIYKIESYMENQLASSAEGVYA